MYRRDNSGSDGGGYGGPRKSFAPVKVGEELDVTIDAVGEKGDGIAKKNGFVLFVPGVKRGQQVRIRVTKVLRKVGFAEVVGAGTKTENAPTEEAAESEEGAEETAEESTEETPPSEEQTEASSGDENLEDSESFGDNSQEE